MPRDAFVFKIQRKLCHPKCARKVSGLSRNGPLVPYIEKIKMTNAPLYCNQVQDKDREVMLIYILFLCDFASETTMGQENKIIRIVRFKMGI